MRLIDADAVLDAAFEKLNSPKAKNRMWKTEVVEYFVRLLIMRTPTAYPQKGKWMIERKEYPHGGVLYLDTCPFCGTQYICGGNFCQNCGADLRGEDDETD